MRTEPAAEIVAPNFELLRSSNLLELLLDEEHKRIVVNEARLVAGCLLREDSMEDILALSGITPLLERESNSRQYGPARQLMDYVAEIREIFGVEYDLAEQADFVEEVAGKYLNLLINESNLGTLSSYNDKNQAIMDRLEKEKKQYIVELTKHDVKWLSPENGFDTKVELSELVTSKGRKFLWANIIQDSNKTKDLFDAIDPSKRSYVVGSILDKIACAIDGGAQATTPESSKANLAYEGKFKKTIFPVWKARNIQGSEYRGFALRIDDVELEDGSLAPAFLIAIACNHNKQNGNHSPVYKGILGGKV